MDTSSNANRYFQFGIVILHCGGRGQCIEIGYVEILQSKFQWFFHHHRNLLVVLKVAY